MSNSTFRQPVIILDEPTSGLDSFIALELTHTLKARKRTTSAAPPAPKKLPCALPSDPGPLRVQKMALRGHIVVASVHQPGSEMFANFGWVMLLGGGAVVWQGKPGAAALELFAGRGAPCPPERSFADHLLQMASNPQHLKARPASAGDIGRDAYRSVGAPVSCVLISTPRAAAGDEGLPERLPRRRHRRGALRARGGRLPEPQVWPRCALPHSSPLRLVAASPEFLSADLQDAVHA